MEADDLLADHVHVRGPILAEELVVFRGIAQGGDVVGERVDPDIDDVLGIEGHLDAPIEGGAGDAQVLQPREQEVLHHLVDAALGLDEFRVLADVFDEPVGIFGKPEEIALLPGEFHRPAAVGALAVLELGLGPEALAGGAIPALVLALIDVALVIELLEDVLHHLGMALLGGADEVVVLDVHQLPQGGGVLGDLVHIGLGGDAGLLGLALDLQAMLVQTGEEIHVVAHELFEAGQGVRGRGAIGMADMQVVAGIVDGRCDIKGGLFHGHLPFHLPVDRRRGGLHGIKKAAGPALCARQGRGSRGTTLFCRFVCMALTGAWGPSPVYNGT